MGYKEKLKDFGKHEQHVEFEKMLDMATDETTKLKADRAGKVVIKRLQLPPELAARKKATHDAVEGLKLQVCRLMAERERFWLDVQDLLGIYGESMSINDTDYDEPMIEVYGSTEENDDE